MSVRARPLGKTGLVVGELALGTWGISGDGYGPVDAAEAERVVARALEIGINLFDTADVYGGGKMEALLGKVLASHQGARVVTKGGTDRTTEPPRKRFDPGHLRASVQRSLKRLGRESEIVSLFDMEQNRCIQEIPLERHGIDVIFSLLEVPAALAFNRP